MGWIRSRPRLSLGIDIGAQDGMHAGQVPFGLLEFEKVEDTGAARRVAAHFCWVKNGTCNVYIPFNLEIHKPAILPTCGLTLTHSLHLAPDNRDNATIA